jgi:hypothetical protein
VQWIMAKAQDTRGENVFALKVGGQMAKIYPYPMLNQAAGMLVAQDLDDVESNANWQEWCAGIDGLGALVMLAASLPI